MKTREIVAIAALVAVVGAGLTPIAAPAVADPGTTYTESVIDVTPSGAVAAGAALAVEVSVSALATGFPEPATSGDVSLFLGETLLGSDSLDVNGVASFTIPSTAVLPGSLELSAEYAGDEVYLASSASTFVTVYFPDYVPSVTPGVMQPFYQDIRWLTGQGITSGYSDATYRPTAPVTRQAMAAFLYRAANPGATAPACTSAPFSDVAASAPFCAEIRWLAEQQISTGYADGTFRPTAAVSRGAMAQFLYRLKTAQQTAPACTSAPFVDLPAETSSCGAVQWLVARAVTNGYSDGTFRPTAAVSRAAMAAFLHRLFGDAIGVLAENAMELPADSVLSYQGDPASSMQVVVADSTATPAVDGIVVLPLGTVGGNGMVGKVYDSYDYDGSTYLSLEPATLDDAYESLRIVSSHTPDATAASSRGVAEALSCSTGVDGSVSIAPNLLAMTADFDLEKRRFRTPKISFSLNYTPSITVNLAATVSASCSADFVAAVIPIAATPPILMKIEPFVELGVETSSALSFTVGTAMRYEMHATGTDVDDNFTNKPFTSLEDPEIAGAVTLTAGVRASALLGGVVGLSGEVGIRGNVGHYTDDANRECYAVKVALIAELSATLDLWITDFSFTLASATLPTKKLLDRCYGGPTEWVGTVTEVRHGTGVETSGYGIDNYVTAVDATTVWTRDLEHPSVQHAGLVTGQWDSQDGFEMVETTNGDVDMQPWQNWLQYYADENDPDAGYVIFPNAAMSGDYDIDAGPNGTFWATSANQRDSAAYSAWGDLPMDCTGARGFPSGIQAIKTTLTVTCSLDLVGEGGWGVYGRHYVYDMTITYEWNMKAIECDTRVDSDGDGVGDCAEFDAGTDTTGH